MLIIEFGIVILVSPEHPWKALFPMFVTEFGMVILVSPEQPWYLQLIVCQLVLAKTVKSDCVDTVEDKKGRNFNIFNFL